MTASDAITGTGNPDNPFWIKNFTTITFSCNIPKSTHKNLQLTVKNETN
jgi:hypothetical protein